MQHGDKPSGERQSDSPAPPALEPPMITPRANEPRKGSKSKRSLPTARPLPTSGASSASGQDTSGKASKRVRRAKSKKAPTPSRDGQSVPIKAEDEDPLEHEDLAEAAIKSAPAWLVSLVVHTLLLITLGLLYVTKDIPKRIMLDMTYAEELGVQLEDDTLASTSMELNDIQDPVYSMDTNPVDDPLATPPDLDRRMEGMMATDSVKSPSVGIALSGREKGMKKALLAAYGGTAGTEAAVARALEWLKRNQRRDGLWSLTGPYSNGAFDDNKLAATAMALLAFQGAGNTHKSGRYKDEVHKAWRALLKTQDRDGNFFHEGPTDHRLYSQAQAMIALCEIYGMTKDSLFKQAAQKTVDYAARVQAEEGGWRYEPGNDSDTSVTGWFVMGLQSAMMAGLDVPSPMLQRVSKYLDSVAMYEGAFYKYQPVRKGFTPSMTAEGLLCRQYLGWRHNNPQLKEGVEYLLENKVDWNKTDLYYWYYATQVLHHMEGDAWDQWNRAMRDEIPKHQIMTGKERGSWPADRDRWGNYGGRLYATCFCTFMLEIYYRHLPIYSYRLD